MKKMLILVLIAAAAVGSWYFFFRGRNRPSIIVYGRNSCSFTQAFISDLRRNGLRYSYKDIDDFSVRREIKPRMEKVYGKGPYYLPAVDVNGYILMQPDIGTVVQLYAAGSPKEIPATQFQKASDKGDPLEISGMIISDEPVAIIGGKVVKKGDTVGAYEVLAIREDSVDFKDGDGKVFTKKK